MKQKQHYERPQTTHTSVEAENGFMNASVVHDEISSENSEVTAGSQTIQENYDFTDNTWE